MTFARFVVELLTKSCLPATAELVFGWKILGAARWLRNAAWEDLWARFYRILIFWEKHLRVFWFVCEDAEAKLWGG